MKRTDDSWQATVTGRIDTHDLSDGTEYWDGSVCTPLGYVLVSTWPFRGDRQCVSLSAVFNGREYSRREERSASEAITTKVGLARLAHQWIRGLHVELLWLRG